MEEYKPDINKLKNYKIKESKFENNDFKTFTNCISTTANEKHPSEIDVDRCSYHLPPSYKIESGGDMRCSGKSEILHLMLPEVRHRIAFGLEEERGSVSSKVKEFTEPDFNKLAIYVKRNPEEKLKCLLRYRSIFREDVGREPDYYDPLPNDLKDEAYGAMDNMRKTMLPSVYRHKNFIVFENENKEKEPTITNDKICRISKKQLEKLKDETENNLKYDKMYIGKGLKKMMLTTGKVSYASQVKYAKETLKYNKEYENICKTSKDINNINKIMDERKRLRL